MWVRAARKAQCFRPCFGDSSSSHARAAEPLPASLLPHHPSPCLLQRSPVPFASISQQKILPSAGNIQKHGVSIVAPLLPAVLKHVVAGCPLSRSPAPQGRGTSGRYQSFIGDDRKNLAQLRISGSPERSQQAALEVFPRYHTPIFPC